MDRRTGWFVVSLLLVGVFVTASCRNAQPEVLATETQMPSLTPSSMPTSTPTSTPTPWPTRKPQEKSNCPAGGWTLYTEESGLIGSYFKSIATGSDGVIWAADFYGTINWLYNGKWSTVPSVSIPEINVMIPLETGGLWVGTQGGQVSLVEGYDRLWTSRVIPMEKGGTAVYDLAISPQGHLWAGTWDGLYELWGDDWAEIPKPVPENVILYSPTALYFDQKGGLWVGARHSFNYYFQGVWSGPSEGIPELVNIEDIEQDSSGNLWFGSITGAFVYDGETWERVYPVDYTPGDTLQTRSLAVDYEGRIWLVSEQDTAVYQAGKWESVIPDVGSQEISIHSVEVDPWGAMWFASNEGVLCYLP